MNANSNMNINLYKNYITVFTLSMIQNLNPRANGFHKICEAHMDIVREKFVLCALTH